MFSKGQIVICIDDSPGRADCVAAMPLKLTKNALYKVRAIHVEPGIEGYGVRLEELLNPSIIWSDGEEKEWSYAAHRFRPVAQSWTEDVALIAHQSEVPKA